MRGQGEHTTSLETLLCDFEPTASYCLHRGTDRNMGSTVTLVLCVSSGPYLKNQCTASPEIASTLFFSFQGKTSQPWTIHQETWNNTHSIGEKYFLFFFSLKLKANIPTSISPSPMLFNKKNFVWRGTWEKGSCNWDDYMEFALSWNYIDPLLPWTDLYHIQVQQTWFLPPSKTVSLGN